MPCITLTFCECSENHVGMEKMGIKSNTGFNSNHLDCVQNYFSGKEIERFNLNDLLSESNIEYNGEKAELLIIRNAVDNHQELFNNLLNLEWDRKYYDTRRQKVLNKHARANLCFSNNSQEPDYENKKGRVVSYNTIPLLDNLRNLVNQCINDTDQLECEGNLYDNVNKNGIGWHGDGERTKVIGVRLGDTMPLCFQWFYKGNSVGNITIKNLNSGDLYVMSSKTVGTDWKRKNIYTLRHSAGSSKYTNPK